MDKGMNELTRRSIMVRWRRAQLHYIVVGQMKCSNIYVQSTNMYM